MQALPDKEQKLGIIYILNTMLDFAGEAKENRISISTKTDENIIKLLKESNEQERKNPLDETIPGKRPPTVNGNR